ncbi:MAG: ATP-dependent helicase [Methanobacteriales archaeon HGW-Methanobacteriales-1]|jgi:DNA helicase-2/ATP-dependent DNA helicase PcrA|nr:MAG: ATP-dependent helicase [Methanobacteriales archaeon HGW-Methanobacteriales-1]
MTNKTLTTSQKKAITHYKGPLMIIAGPGAGKTWVLIQKVTNLIRHHKVSPEHILLTTFTIKASEELKARLSNEIGEKAENVHISTIHSFCKSILEDYPEYHNLGSGFDVLDEESQLMFLRSNLGEFDNIREDRLVELLDFYNKCGENEIDPDILIEKINERYPHNKTYQKICLSYKKYLELLGREHKIDFSGLQIAVLDILENNPDILNDLRDKYQFLLIDEYQDTSSLQDKIFQLIAHPQNNICVVGDDDQSIYSFRGANIFNFVKFPEKYPETKVVRLNKNFRSTKNIIKASELFMGKHRLVEKEIEPWRSKGNELVLLKNNTEGEEAHQIVKLIHDMKEHGIVPHYGYVTLLFRSVKYHAGAIIRELKKEKINYTIRGDKSFLKRDEIQNILFLMHYVDSDDYGKKFKTRWGRWWNLDLFLNDFMDISPETVDILKKMEDSAPENDKKIMTTDLNKNIININQLKTEKEFKQEGIINKKDITKLMALNIFKNDLKTNQMDVLSIFYKLLDISTYLKRLTYDELTNTEKLDGDINNKNLLQNQSNSVEIDKSPLRNPWDSAEEKEKGKKDKEEEKEEKEDVLFNLSKLSGIIKRYQEFSKEPSLEDFLKFLFKLPKKLQYDEEMLEDPRALKIMTVHQAKGLEFPVVFICGAAENKFPLKSHYKDILPIPSELLKFIPDGQVNEERRLFYVAMTRAQDNLIISPGGKKSQFIEHDIGIEEFSDVDKIIEKCEERELAHNPLQVSFSSISTYETCPFRYKLIYYYLFEYQPTQKQKYGTILHHCLNRIHQAIQDKEDIDENKIQSFVDKSWAPLHENELKNHLNKAHLVKKLIFYYDNMKNYIKEVISTEEPFALFKADTLITGRTDLIIKNPENQLELVDFKARGESALERLQVELQLKIYEYGLQKKYNFDKMCAYHFDSNDQTYYPPEKDFQDIESHVQSICQGINNNQFQAIPSRRCVNCFFSFVCEDILD